MHLETMFYGKAPGEVRGLPKQGDIAQVRRDWAARYQHEEMVGVVIASRPNIIQGNATIVATINFPAQHMQMDVPWSEIYALWRVVADPLTVAGAPTSVAADENHRPATSRDGVIGNVGDPDDLRESDAHG